MSKSLSLCVAGLLAVQCFASAGELPSDQQASPVGMEKSSAELSWRKNLADTKNARTGLLTGGGVLGVAGIGLMVAGNIKAGQADQVDGCERNGFFDVNCHTQAQADEAQSRIDEGRKLISVGLVVAVVGGGLLWGGSRKTEKIDELEKEGRRNGYSLTMTTPAGKGVRVALSKSF